MVSVKYIQTYIGMGFISGNYKNRNSRVSNYFLSRIINWFRF